MDRIYEPQYALMYYNHRNETEFLEWRSEMDRLAMNNEAGFPATYPPSNIFIDFPAKEVSNKLFLDLPKM